jgi:hypothetical protein
MCFMFSPEFLYLSFLIQIKNESSMKSKLLLFALLFLFSRSYSQWERVTTGADSTVYYVNPLYVSEVKDYQDIYMKAWVKASFKKFTSPDGKEYNNVEIKSLYWFDCINAREKALSWIMSKSTGEVISSSDIPDPWSNIAPETVAETLLTKICSLKK